MAATYTTQGVIANATLRMLDFDPDATSPVLVDLDPATSGEGFAIANYRRFVVGLFRSVGTGTVAAFEIVADNDDDLASPTVVVSHAIGSAPDAVGDTIWLECDVEQIREVDPAATHVGVRIDLATATDECVVFFGAFEPTYPRKDLTADRIA